MSFQSMALPNTASAQPLAQILKLHPGRTHELCGPARQLLAVWIMAQQPPSAPVIWIRPDWKADRVNPQALCDWASPEGLIVVESPREADSLACAEEALRSGAVALVVMELASPLALTPLRRLHLAAEAGLDRRRIQARDSTVLGLVLTPENGGTAGVESRWHLASHPSAASAPPAWTLQRLRARMKPPAAWRISRLYDEITIHSTAPEA
ncbi:ImuA family protein [Roseinatronobacter monicus]|uniref:ImuA family protein n=1 Tax=Roseinatronobacter monicus TaxID=393481 RepID=UPI003F320239